MTEIKKWKVHGSEFKAKVGLEGIRGLRTTHESGQEHGVHPVQVGQWKNSNSQYDSVIPYYSTCCSKIPNCQPIDYKEDYFQTENCWWKKEIVERAKTLFEGKRAPIVLKAAARWQDDEIGKALDVSTAMVDDIRKRWVEEGPEAALKDRPRPGQRRKRDDRQAAHLSAVACSDAPEGHDLGPCGGWPTRWLSWAMQSRSVMRRYARF